MKKVVLIVTGSISAYKAASVAAGFQKRDCEVKVIMTDAATKLICPATFAGITHSTVYTDSMWFSSAETVPHINLAKWADIILVCPATANTIAKLAHGIADNIATATCLAASGMKKEVIIAPAMNNYMLTNDITQNNIELLKEYDFAIINPKVGHLACGDEGIGHLRSTKEIIDEVLKNE